ncbi:phage tail tip lysozyme [Pseudomonas sp.]|uniref:phage tail tip lysozyme n=1 Tax=Pseudomonas sp. TaxID=306 RepID=UPI002582A840|nr:phage tail tip lysozyme [Pseudomonas sp.]
MADSDVIKEFLVGLGFKVDQKGLKNFTGTIDGATKAVAGLVATIAGAALTVSAGVTAFASNLEGLYFASQRIGASATNLKSAEYAARDLGATAEQVRGSLEGMARFLRDNPGGEGFLQGIGVATRDANGNLKDTTELMVGLGAKLRAMPWYQAKQYAGVLGIDDNTLRAILSGEFGRKLDENRKKLANSGMDQATKDAHAFMEGIRRTGLQFDAFAVQVEAALLKRLGPDMHGLSEWFEKNGPIIAARLAEVAGDLVDMAKEAGPYIEQIFDFFVRLDAATDGWSTKLIGVLFLLRALGAGSLIRGIAGLAGALTKVGVRGAAGALGVGGATVLAGAGAMLYSGELNVGEDDEVRRRRALEDAAAGEVNGGNDMARRLMGFFRSLGWSQAQAAGIVANLSAESGFNPEAVGDGGNAYGVAQWHPDRQRAFEKWSGKNIRQSTLEDQLRFVHYELTQGAEKRAGQLLKAAQNADQAGSIVSRYYERPAATDAEAARRGAAAVQIAQTTNINVHGSGDPHSTAKAVAGEQGRVVQDMTRNLGSAVN